VSGVPPVEPRFPALPGVALASGVRLGALRDRFGGDVDHGALDRQVQALASPEEADARCLAPVFSRRSLGAALRCEAALLVDASLGAGVPAGRRWVHPHAQEALASLLESITAPRVPRRSPVAVVEPGASVGRRVDIGAGAVVLDGCAVGDDCVVGPNAVLYGGVRLGARVSVGAGAVVGRPGFGWVTGGDGVVRRMPQLGGVVVEDDVEIGALATVDAGTLSPTRLGRGCKLDAHVHVGHNVVIGAGVIVAAQAGFAGSARLGDGVLVGGQAGVADHVVVGPGARLAAKAGVIGNIPPGTAVAGYPAVERVRWLRSVARALRGESS
jgi:UDP-3-O-[3-hydroxymyristoyl] glucosamine N-acyltransferase